MHHQMVLPEARQASCGQLRHSAAAVSAEVGQEVGSRKQHDPVKEARKLCRIIRTSIPRPLVSACELDICTTSQTEGPAASHPEIRQSVVVLGDLSLARLSLPSHYDHTKERRAHELDGDQV
jgi:hypothetical protein